MSTATVSRKTKQQPTPSHSAPPSELHDYRAVCSAAVVSLVIAVIGLSAFWISALLLISIVGMLLGIYAWATIRSRRDELTGMGLAKASIAISTFAIIAGGGWHGYVYATEVPDGYERISYRSLQADPGRPADRAPDAALELDGKDVFIKGYILDTAKAKGIKSFFLVRDKGDCCFGGNPEIDERVLVELDSQSIEYTNRQSKVVGQFAVAPETMRDAKGRRVLYTLKGKVLQ
ncbi:MAG: hypothetical protein MI757_10005 [Pirellulales bacterium]|nr:hypothetical protein [Pirellulales bacterium]